MAIYKYISVYFLYNLVSPSFATPLYLDTRQDGNGAFGGVVGSIPSTSSSESDIAAFQNAQCTNPAIADAATDPITRWTSVGSETAWDAAVLSWINRSSSNNLSFSQQISNFFHGPDNWICTDIGNTPCEETVECSDVDYPAGFLILNSMQTIHTGSFAVQDYKWHTSLTLNLQIAKHIESALDAANIGVQPNIGTFASTFAPAITESSGEALFKGIVDSLALMAGVVSAFGWNIVVTEGELIASATLRDFAKDSSNAGITFAVNTIKDQTNAAQQTIDRQNDLDTTLAQFFTVFKSWNSNYLQSIFSGDQANLTDIGNLVSNGMMLSVQDKLDLSSMTAEAEKVLYSKLIPTAWSIAPPNGLYPFILQTDFPCDLTGKSMPKDLQKHLSSKLYTSSQVCYLNNAYFVLNARYDPKNFADQIKDNDIFDALPGGNVTTLRSGNIYGGILLDDLVISSVQGYQNNGNQNGFVLDPVNTLIDGAGTKADIAFQNGIQTPGYSGLTVCSYSNIAAIQEQIQTRGSGNPPPLYFPCGVSS